MASATKPPTHCPSCGEELRLYVDQKGRNWQCYNGECHDYLHVFFREPLKGDAANGQGEPARAIAMPTPVVVQLSAVKREEVRWRWKDRLPLGRLTGWIGDPEAGKSFSALAIAAAITTGAPLPGDTERWPPAKVLVLTAEDGLADTVVPRLEDMGADLRNAVALKAIRDEQGQEHHPDLGKDLAAIEVELATASYQLVIIDPLNAYLGSRLDTNRDAALRSVLGPLSDLAERHDAAILFVMHLTKGPRDRAIYRGQGNIAYVAAARVVHLVGVNPADEEERVIVEIKNNLAPKPPAVSFEIKDGRLLWRGESSVTAAALLAPDEPAEQVSALQEAKDFLLDALADGAQPAKELEREAEAAGIRPRTLKRAREELGVRAMPKHEIGKKGVRAWLWRLGDHDPTTINDGLLNDSVPESDREGSQDGLLNPLLQLALEELPAAKALEGDRCSECGEDVWAYGPDGTPHCERHALADITV